MQVSVIIPTYNRIKFLPRAINSVLGQKGVSLELIVVDDGSTDGTRELITNNQWLINSRYANSLSATTSYKLSTISYIPIIYIYQPNQGPAAARNAGIAKAQGKFIAFLDSDDEWLAGKLEAQLAYFKANPESLICQTEEIWIRNGKRVNPMKKHKKEGGFIFERSLELCLVSPSAVIMRREFFETVGLFDPTLPACEDYDLWLRATARLPIGLIEKPYVIRYAGHRDQRSRQFPVMDAFRIRSLQKILGSGILNPSQREATLKILKKKCRIVSQGALKRGKIQEAKYYEALCHEAICS